MNKITKKLIISVTFFIFLSLCSSCSGKNGSFWGWGSGKKGSGKNGQFSESDLNYQREARFGDGSGEYGDGTGSGQYGSNLPYAEGDGEGSGGLFRDINFDYNSSQISPSEMQDIEYNANVLEQYPDLRLVLEGHCDERGTSEYNLSLGAQRARSVSDILVSYGVNRSRLETISYGEELPLESGNSERAWAANRRVHFSGFSG